MTNRQKNPLLYKIIRAIFYALFMIVYHPKIVNKAFIPKEGRAVLVVSLTASRASEETSLGHVCRDCQGCLN